MPLLRWAAPGPYVVAFSTRVGGVSRGAYASLNLGRLTEDDPARVEENRRLLAEAVAADPARMTLNRQVHGAQVHRARSGRRGRPGDGLWTDEAGVPLVVLAADCLPVALVRPDHDGPALAVLHVGRSGLLAGLVGAGVAAVGSGAVAVVGPGIGACCYEVGEEVLAPYRARFGSGVVRNGRLDLRAATSRALTDAGCAWVDHVDVCTACDGERFFSHRRDAGVTGRQGVIASIAPDAT